MTDNAEREVRKWALKRNGDAITNKDVVELVFAFADDQEADHKETLSLIEDLKQGAEKRERRILQLENYAEDARKTCADRVRKLIGEEHESRHGKHMDEYHSLETERADWLIRLASGKFGGLLLVLLGSTLMALISYLIWGKP